MSGGWSGETALGAVIGARLLNQGYGRAGEGSARRMGSSGSGGRA